MRTRSCTYSTSFFLPFSLLSSLQSPLLTPSTPSSHTKIIMCRHITNKSPTTYARISLPLILSSTCMYPSLGSRVVPSSLPSHLSRIEDTTFSRILPHTISGYKSCRKTTYTGIRLCRTITCIFEHKATMEDITLLRLYSAVLQYFRNLRKG
jgi:hypothetical protein